jgi:ornithine cyclodeaminase/alanine dehydrogenase-like protein (mu-crystallin family)
MSADKLVKYKARRAEQMEERVIVARQDTADALKSLARSLDRGFAALAVALSGGSVVSSPRGVVASAPVVVGAQSATSPVLVRGQFAEASSPRTAVSSGSAVEPEWMTRHRERARADILKRKSTAIASSSSSPAKRSRLRD